MYDENKIKKYNMADRTVEENIEVFKREEIIDKVVTLEMDLAREKKKLELLNSLANIPRKARLKYFYEEQLSLFFETIFLPMIALVGSVFSFILSLYDLLSEDGGFGIQNYFIFSVTGILISASLLKGNDYFWCSFSDQLLSRKLLLQFRETERLNKKVNVFRAELKKGEE